MNKKRVCSILIAVVFLFGALSLLSAEEELEAAKKKAVDLVDSGIAHINAVGAEKAFKDFTDKNGGFVDGSYYIFIVDFRGLTLAHGGNPALVGQSMFELKDADGMFFIQEFITVAKENGTGWVDYKWSNPTSKKVERKSTYVNKMEGTEYFLGCGIYLGS